MSNKILEFKKAVDTNRKLYVCEELGIYSIRNGYYGLIELDNEDINYLRNKYLSKLSEEMNAKIDQIKKEYEAL